MLKEKLIKHLNDWNFKFHRRECIGCSKYGTVDDGIFVPDEEVILEDWSNKDFVEWLLEDK